MGASPHFIVVTGFAGLVAGAFSMAMGEYTSVRTQNEQVDRGGQGARGDPGRGCGRGARARVDIHWHGHDRRDRLGLDPRDKPSPKVAAISSFVTFSLGGGRPAPFLLGFTSLVAGLAIGGLGLFIAGGRASLATTTPWW